MGRVRRIGGYHMGPSQAPTESVPALNTEHCRIGPFRHRIDNRSRRHGYTPAVSRFDPGNKGGSSTHYTRHLPVHTTSNLSGSHHRHFWRAGVRLKSVWSLDYVSPDPDIPQQDQDGGEDVDRSIRRCLPNVQGGYEQADPIHLLR